MPNAAPEGSSTARGFAELLAAAPMVPGVAQGSALAHVEAFRRARLLALHEGLVHGPLAPGGLLALHLLPLDAQERHLPLAEHRDRLRQVVPVPGSGSADARFNVDGVAMIAERFEPQGSAGGPRDVADAVQWFRSGGIEAASTSCVMPPGATHYRSPVLWGPFLADLLLRGVPAAVTMLHESLEFDSPLVLSAALVGMRGVPLVNNRGDFSPYGPGIDRPLVLAPWYPIRSDADTAGAARLLAEVLWESAGRQLPAAGLHE